MRQQFWIFDSAKVDLEDRDVTVDLIHKKSLTQIQVRFRLKERQMGGPVKTLQKRLETLATDLLLDVASCLDGS